MLTTETFVLEESIVGIESRIDDLDAELEDLPPEGTKYDTVTGRLDLLTYQRDGLIWQRDEGGWGSDAEIELGALAAGEQAMMHREMPDDAHETEGRLWFVAASTESAPYSGDSLKETFRAVANCHLGFVSWAESTANGLGVPIESGNRSGRSSQEIEVSGTSTPEPNTTTSSPSDSPTE